MLFALRHERIWALEPKFASDRLSPDVDGVELPALLPLTTVMTDPLAKVAFPRSSRSWDFVNDLVQPLSRAAVES